MHTTKHLHSATRHTNATIHLTQCQQPSNKSGDKLPGAVELPQLGSPKNVRACAYLRNPRC